MLLVLPKEFSKAAPKVGDFLQFFVKFPAAFGNLLI
jgi:hypothetical protein